MSDQTNPSILDSMPEDNPDRGRTLLFVVIIVLAIAVLGALASGAFSASYGFGFGPGPWHHGGFMGGHADPAWIEDRADRAVRHLAIEIDATPEQQAKLQAVVKAAVKDLLPLREQVHAARLKARELLTAPTVNRDEIEKLRAEQLTLLDTGSKRLAQALADAAEILTPEQRRTLSERFPPGGGFWHRWHHG